MVCVLGSRGLRGRARDQQPLFPSLSSGLAAPSPSPSQTSGPSPGQASVKQACDWCCGPGQLCSTGRRDGEQRRLRPCIPGPQVRLHGSHGPQEPQTPQSCSSKEASASFDNSQSGFPSQTWGSNRLRLLARCTRPEPTRSSLPPEVLTSRKSRQVPFGQENSGQGTPVPLVPPGADSLSGEERTVS